MPLASRFGGPGTTPGVGDSPGQGVIRSEILDHQPYIENTFINKTSFNPQTYAEEFKILQRYSAGSRITVTYFLLSTPTGSLQRATTIDPSSLRSPVQTSYTEIKNLEIVVQKGGLQSEYNADSCETKITGEALLYPGMKPRKGDLFVTQIGDATFGIFQIVDVERLTYRQGANHKILFFLREFATEDGVNTIRQSVTKTVWFDKETYLGDATTLLNEESYGCLKILRQMRSVLIKYYFNTFYNKNLNSIVSPEGVYDPYLVAYLTSKISILESVNRPVQLYPALQNYDNSIWARLTDDTNRSLVGLQANYNIVRYHVTRWDVSITSLVNRTMISLDNANRQAMEASLLSTSNPPPQMNWQNRPSPTLGWSLQPVATDQPGYVLSTNFYTGDKTVMTPLEFLVYSVIMTRKLVYLKDFIDLYLMQYTQLTYDEQFYAIPLYLWMIDLAVDGISAPNSFMT